MTHRSLKSIRNQSLTVSLAIALVCFALHSPARAYHFFYDKPPTPNKWASLPVNFLVDNGPTNILPEIQSAFNTWNNISTAKNVLGTATLAAGDFNGANQGSSWGIMTGDGKQEVIFDEDGSALAKLGLPVDSVNGYGPTATNNGTIIDAFLIINGKRTNFDRQSTEVHELGHIQGLAHSSVGMHNSASFPSDALDPISISAVPTMHPSSDNTGTNRRSLEADDIAALSELYPETSFTTTLGSIQGTVIRCAGDKAVTGANVRVVNATNASIQLSRFTGFDGNGEGRFVINGVPPGTYRLVVEPMGANGFVVATRFGTPPNAQEDDFPTEYYNPPDEDSCVEELPDKAVNVTVTAGGTASGKNFKVGAVDLAFVVDDTGSMGPEIGGVRTALTQFVNVMDGINKLTGIRFPNTAVITFKDDVTKRTVSNDAARLKTVIGGLTASGGDDCPESSNAAVLAAGRLLKKGGVAILFTDADSRSDGPDRNTVTQLYRSKSLILATLLSGTCSGSFAAPPEMSQPLGPANQMDRIGRGGGALDEIPTPATLGVESSIRTFSEESILTGGIFTSIPGIKTGDTTETQRYINTGANLSVASVVPAISLVSPGDGPRTGTLNIEINGSNTNFQSSSKVEIAGGGITVNSRTVNSPEKITANITIQTGAATGFRDITVTTTLGAGVTETATGYGAFNVVVPPTSPTITGVVPSQAGQGETLNVSISGLGTHFLGGTSIADFGAGVTVNSLTVVNATTAIANIAVTPNAGVGLRDVKVKTGIETAAESVVGPFLVTAPAPVIPLVTDVAPAVGKQDQTLTIALVGKNTNFAAGKSVVSFSGSGIVVNSTNVTSATSLTANISISATATLGFRDVFVTTASENASILSAFQVACNPLISPQTLQFNSASFSAAENGGTALVTVTRNACEATGSLSVGYATSNGTAKEGKDYTAAQGVLNFAPGETTKSFSVLIIDNGFVDGSRTVNLSLSSPTGAALASPSSGVLTIADNDTTAGINPADTPRSFVQFHYYDFLGRFPDQSGWDFWTNTISGCGVNQSCIDAKRINASGAFFLSIEFQETGYLVYRIYKSAFGNIASAPVPIRFEEFLPDTEQIRNGVVVNQGNWQAQLEANKVAFTQAFVQRSRFIAAYPTAMTPAAFVDLLFLRAGVTPSTTQRNAAIAEFGTATNTVDTNARARALRGVAENPVLNQQEFNRAFVLMQYFGYLRRNPYDAPEATRDYSGYDFWLIKLNQFKGDYIAAEMVKAFISSGEYRQRFGP